MKTIHFPYIALGVGLVFLLMVTIGRQAGPDGDTALPLLTLLVVSEFAFFATGFGAYIGFKQIQTTGFQLFYALVSLLCGLLSIRFMLLGIDLWPL